MPGFIDFVVDQFYHNQFMTAAVLATPAALLTYSARAVPSAVWNGLKRLSSVELRFNSDMDEYYKVQTYIMDTVVSARWSRNFTYRYENRCYSPVDHAMEESYVAVGYGNHLGWWRGKPVWIRRDLEGGSNTDKFKESIDLVFLGRGSNRVNEFLAGLEKFIRLRAEDKKIYLFANSHSSWSNMTTLTERSVQTVVVNNNGAQRAVEHIRQFELAKEWYRKRGMPHHTGILLEGPPGTGKSSLIHALASATQRNLFYLNLAALENEQDLMQLIGDKRSWANAILVLEDLDVSGAKVDRTKEGPQGKVTLSTLLNILDGLLSPDGLVVVATTNHPDSLDPALLRAGRFDFRLRLDALDESGFMDLARVFEIDQQTIDAVVSNYSPTTGAVLRGLFIAGPEELRAHFAADPRPRKLHSVVD